jgi:hypothetical protein
MSALWVGLVLSAVGAVVADPALLSYSWEIRGPEESKKVFSREKTAGLCLFGLDSVMVRVLESR